MKQKPHQEPPGLPWKKWFPRQTSALPGAGWLLGSGGAVGVQTHPQGGRAQLTWWGLVTGVFTGRVSGF